MPPRRRIDYRLPATTGRTRPRVTPSDELLLFVTEPQQLDAVVEYGTETLSPDSIRVEDFRDLSNPCPDDCDCAGCEFERDPWDEDDHGPDCDCDTCENDRALDDDAAAYFDREV